MPQRGYAVIAEPRRSSPYQYISVNHTKASRFIENGKIAEEIGLDDGVTALTQLGLIQKT